MYVQGFVVPVTKSRTDEYVKMAEDFFEILKEYGVLHHVECREMDVPDGEVTDFRRAVALEENEEVWFSWLVWPDKATADSSHEKMMADPRMANMPKDMPFNGKRMIHGGFEPLVWLGESK
jgi:uncharacterized protein YbaA (DUF1428 family)